MRKYLIIIFIVLCVFVLAIFLFNKSKKNLNFYIDKVEIRNCTSDTNLSFCQKNIVFKFYSEDYINIRKGNIIINKKKHKIKINFERLENNSILYTMTVQDLYIGLGSLNSIRNFYHNIIFAKRLDIKVDNDKTIILLRNKATKFFYFLDGKLVEPKDTYSMNKEIEGIKWLPSPSSPKSEP